MKKNSQFDKVHLQWFADDDGDDGKKNADDNKDDDNKQTVTAEQFAELKKEYEAIKKAQSGSDRRVKELSDALKQKEQEKEVTVESTKKELDELRKQLKAKDLAEMRFRKISEAGASGIGKLFDIDVNSEEGVDQFIEAWRNAVEAGVENRYQKTVEEKFPKDKGKPQSGKVSGEPNYEDLQNMSDEEIKALPQDTFNKIMGN